MSDDTFTQVIQRFIDDPCTNNTDVSLVFRAWLKSKDRKLYELYRSGSQSEPFPNIYKYPEGSRHELMAYIMSIEYPAISEIWLKGLEVSRAL